MKNQDLLRSSQAQRKKNTRFRQERELQYAHLFFFPSFFLYIFFVTQLSGENSVKNVEKAQPPRRSLAAAEAPPPPTPYEEIVGMVEEESETPQPDVIIVERFAKRSVAILSLNFRKELPMRMHGAYRHLPREEEKQFPYFKSEWDLRKGVFEKWCPSNFLGVFEEWDEEEQEYVEVQKGLGLWDYMNKKLGELYPDIATGENWELRVFVISRFAANENYSQGFCCRKGLGECDCVEKARDMGEDFNPAWFCCCMNSNLCALFHNSFIRHDIKCCDTARGDLASAESVQKIMAKQAKKRGVVGKGKKRGAGKLYAGRRGRKR